MNPGRLKHRRRSIRLKDYDYALAGAYFVTICIQSRLCVLGKIITGALVASAPGRMVQSVWDDIPNHYPGVGIDVFVVMPNHVHGIVLLSSAASRDSALSLPDMIHRFKSLTTTRYRQDVDQLRWPPFDRRLWQRNYYEHVIRNQTEMARAREYIVGNPAKWEEDEYNSANA